MPLFFIFGLYMPILETMYAKCKQIWSQFAHFSSFPPFSDSNLVTNFTIGGAAIADFSVLLFQFSQLSTQFFDFSYSFCHRGRYNRLNQNLQ